MVTLYSQRNFVKQNETKEQKQKVLRTPKVSKADFRRKVQSSGELGTVVKQNPQIKLDLRELSSE